MIKIKSKEEILLIYKSAQLVSKTLGLLAKEIKPGITSLYLDKLAETHIRDNGGIPGFLGLYNFPNTLCVSPNNQVVHGIPNNIPLKEGDILSVDCGVLMNGFYGDHAYTFQVGEVNEETQKLLTITKESLYLGIRKCRSGNKIGDVANAIQTHCEKNGYGVVRELVGHGLGKELHEDPQIPNFGKKGTKEVIRDGMTLAIEPMINGGTHKVINHKDGWTITTKDNQPSAHFEHNVAIIKNKPVLLSTFKYIYDALNIVSDEENDFLFQL
jgi:methionyl aminopeptidase